MSQIRNQASNVTLIKTEDKELSEINKESIGITCLAWLFFIRSSSHGFLSVSRLAKLISGFWSIFRNAF